MRSELCGFRTTIGKYGDELKWQKMKCQTHQFEHEWRLGYSDQVCLSYIARLSIDVIDQTHSFFSKTRFNSTG